MNRRYPDYTYEAGKRRSKQMRQSTCRMKPEDLLECLRTEIKHNIARRAAYIAKCEQKYHVHIEVEHEPSLLSYTVEDVAGQYRVKKSIVENCFRKLNQEGLLGQGRNHTPHGDEGSPREGHWVATRFYVRYPDDVDCSCIGKHDGRPNRRRK